ncbi:MAG: long-chain fatty acid--CoA ligase [Limisphaerales bacterium]
MSTTGLTALARQLRGMIRAGEDPLRQDAAFSRMALELFRLQFHANASYRRWVGARAAGPAGVSDWRDLPAVPASAFKETELTSLPAPERTHVFHSSGTTQHRPGRHFHGTESLALYEDSLAAWFAPHLVPQAGPLTCLSLTPAPGAAPRSSLAHMFGVIRHRHGDHHSSFLGTAGEDGWTVEAAAVKRCLNLAGDDDRPVLLAGTAFNFVHLLDGLAGEGTHFRLPAGSRVMETGGYKGRSRELPRAELHAAITARLGVPYTHIVSEYGMSELSSQAYDLVAGQSGPRAFRFPPWARALVVSPETGREAAEGETGRLRIVDLANVWSVAAVQTDDLAVRRDDGFELVGRAPAAEPRGCSLLAT